MLAFKSRRARRGAGTAAAVFVAGLAAVTVQHRAGAAENIALSGTASASSTAFDGFPEKGIDNNTNGQYGPSVTHTDNTTDTDFWQVDLNSSGPIGTIQLFDRTDCCIARLTNVRLSVLDGADAEVWGEDITADFGGSELFYPAAGTVGQKVRVQSLAGSQSIDPQGPTDLISLAEVQVFRPVLTNVALTGTASQSSEGFGGAAGRGNDGNADGNYGGNSVTHTNAEDAAFWMVDLGSTVQNLDSVQVFNRTDCCGERLANFRVSVLDSSMQEVFGEDVVGMLGAAQGNRLFQLPAGTAGQFVRVQFASDGVAEFLSLAEVQVFTAVIPEPASLSVAGLASLGLFRRRRM